MIIGIDASRAVTEQKTGTEAYAHFLIEHLLPLTAAAGHQVRLYFNEEEPQVADGLAERYPGDHVTIVNIPLNRLWTHVRLGQTLRSERPDVFFTPAHVIPAGYNRPSVATIHDLGYHAFPEAHTAGQLRYLRWSTRHNAKVSHIAIADSQATKNDLQNIYGIPEAKIEVIYPGISAKLKKIGEPEAIMAVKKKYGIRGDYLLFIGSIQPRKNLVKLINAYDHYFNNAIGRVHKLVLAGKKGWQAETIEQTLLALDFPNYTGILMPGFIDENDKAALISGATAMLYPSLYEGFGFPLLEAQRCGTPVLAANTSSLPEIGGPHGALYVNPDDQDAIYDGMLRLMQDSELRESLVTAGLTNSRRFGWPKTAEQVLDVLERVARDGKS